MTILKHRTIAAAAALLALGAASPLPAENAPLRTSPIGAGAEWPSINGDRDETGFSRLDQVNAGNAARLGLAWYMDLPGEGGLEASPIVVGGIMYFTGSHAAVYALDAASGRLLWKYDPRTWEFNPQKLLLSFAVNRGVAYDNGRIFGAAFDGRLFALDARTGKLLWIVETVDRGSPQPVTGAPRVFNGKVVIGQGGADAGARGYVSAYDQQTGKQLWRVYMAPGRPEENKGDPVMERIAATWTGEWWKTGTGGAPWDSITFDAEMNRIYVGTANANPYDPEQRSPGNGDNLFTASIVALDANTGRYAWHYQVNPRDAWDYDSTQQMTLATLNLDGKPRKVLMQAPKNGFFYVIDRVTGKPISAEKFGKATWADRIDLETGRPVESATARYSTDPAIHYPASAHSWMRMAYSPLSGLVYIPYIQTGVRYHKGRPDEGDLPLSGVNIGGHNSDAGDGKGALIAWDPVAQRQRWRVQYQNVWNGGTLATAGNLVFQGTADGYLNAYDARSGARLWRSYVGMGIVAAPATYAIGGRQYVSVLAGYGGQAGILFDFERAGWKYSGPRRVLTFALGGKVHLPPSAPPSTRIVPADNPAEQLDPAKVAMGKAMWMGCIACHGRDAASAGGAPDLRESAIALDPAAFRQVVLEGALLERGMPKVTYFNADQVEAIRQYVRSRAREELQRPSPQE